MASQKERKSIRSLQGLSPRASLIPNHAPRWKGPPKPIAVPGAMGNSAVKNPYLKTVSSASTNRTNPTASRTILSLAPRKTVRDTGPKSYSTQSSVSQNKGKGRSITPELQPSHEIIDVDADLTSTDALDLIADSPPTTSVYFDSEHASSLRAGRNEEPIAGPSLIGDGEHTKRLQAKHEDTKSKSEPNRQSISPIGSFSEIESVPKAEVREKVAMFEALGSGNSKRLPVVNFKKSKKNGMQPRGGFSKPQPGPPPQIVLDSLSEPSGFGKRVSRPASVHHSSYLPIAMVCLGIQQCPEYGALSLDDEGKTIKISGRSSQTEPILLPVSEKSVSELQFSDPRVLEPGIHAPILHLKPSESAQFPPWQSHFSSVFQPGRKDNRGQLAIKFNTEDPAWDLTVYKRWMDKLKPHAKSSVLRPTDSRVLWSALEKGAKYCSGDVEHSLTYLAKQSEGGRSRRFEENCDLDAVSTSSSSRIKRTEDLQKFRHAPDNKMVPLGRKRISDTQSENKVSTEISMVEPPPKRQRTEESRSLRRSTRQQEKAANYDADELILVYPFGVPGAVNVTAGDLARLQPEEFLNDTLIEFGLKSWLRELEATNPVLASQVYLFNSFFYKKLNKRNIQEGFHSVRKWTSKIDIFSKKYVIIPINEHLHWYLAVIYEPEHVLQQLPYSLTPHSNVMTRKQTRDLRASEEVVGAESRVEVRGAASSDVQDGTASENEVERLAFSTSCSVTTTNEHSSTTSSASDLKEALVKEASDTLTPDIVPGSPMSVDVELPAMEIGDSSSSRSAVSDSMMANGANTRVEVPDGSQAITMLVDVEVEVTPARFYGKSYTSKPRKQEHTGSEESVVNGLPRTKIFILDSLGNRHPQAMKQLTNWLHLEALDKKNVPKPVSAVTKTVPVPVQPNYCDCGLYVLHFAKTFMSDPQHYCQMIMTKERTTMSERQADWKDESVATMREELRGKILMLSEEWRQLRAAREEEKKQQQQEQQKVEESDEDSDVAIVEHVKASGKKGRSRKTTRTKG